MLKDGDKILPWRAEGDHYSEEIINSFAWRYEYGFSALVMNAHLDWWYGQIFCNELIEFKYTHDMGIGAFARVPGTLDSLCEGLFGCLEFITEMQYLNLRDTEMHWSLFTYGTGHNLRYCIVYGTMALLNNDSRGFNMLNVPLVLCGMIETSLSVEMKIVATAPDTMMMINALKLTCSKFEGIYDVLQDMNNIIRIDLREARAVHRLYQPDEQIFINYGDTYSTIWYITLTW
jgi:hypothetical protein